ncbi:FecR family protein [Acetobacter okinawensis]|uniref:FecR family protein n=1 Tax=Acetobacter okinawensis TaxID=1076594 RepID=UPI001BABA8D5|nr:FecR domain-containing protein [Acetobacter okinawensis]MBS0967197.1 FecR domain-containing protein [Acetobacter okinawensis]MBS0989455.1 FecR domain-containing protein [Acetobacter okinawensis]
MNVQDEVDDFQPSNAAEWLLVLRDDPHDAHLQARFEVWLQEKPERRREWAQISHTMSVLRRVEPTQDTTSPVVLQYRAAAVRRRFIASVSVAAAAALVGIIWGPDALLRLRADNVTGWAETRTVVLADGSQVVMAPESAIDTDYTKGQREVRLLKGEALFTVRHDSAHPFRVIAGQLTITDVGTVFDVKAGGTVTEAVAVREGRVSVENVASHDAPVQLDAGQMFQVKAGKGVTDAIVPQEVGLWAQGFYVAHSQPVSEVVGVLSHYLRGTVLVHGHDLGAEKVSGLYKLSDARSALQTLADGQNARIWNVTPWLTILNR